MSDIAIRVEGLSKKYRIGHLQRRHDTLRDQLADQFTRSARTLFKPGRGGSGGDGNSEDVIWALKDVSFEVERGEVVGIIGRNGAGKSTLLKILSRITEPTEGFAEIHGRLGTLLEVGTGFHPELTGRENIYLSGAIMGMKRAEIERKFDEIVAFAEVEKFIDTPVKHFSSGMYVRLAFAVAAHLEPEILLVDEVLAVGDAAFQKKCLGKMGEVASEGRTVLFVSHNMAAIEALCLRVILFQSGGLKAQGDSHRIVSEYLTEGVDLTLATADLRDRARGTYSQELALKKVWIVNEAGTKSNRVIMGKDIEVGFEFESERPLYLPGFGFVVTDENGIPILSLNNYTRPSDNNSPRSAKSGSVKMRISKLPLLPGTYFININLVEADREWVDQVERAIALHVEPADVYGSGKVPDPRWGKIFVNANITLE